MLSAGSFPNNEEERLDLILRTISSCPMSIALQALAIEGVSTIPKISKKYPFLPANALLGRYMSAMECDIVTRGRNNDGVVFGLSKNAKSYITPSVSLALNWFYENRIYQHKVLGKSKKCGNGNPPYKHYSIVNFLYETRGNPITEMEVIKNLETDVSSEHFDNLREAGIISGRATESKIDGHFCYGVVKKRLTPMINIYFPKECNKIMAVLKGTNEVTRKSFEDAGFSEESSNAIICSLIKNGWLTCNMSGRHNESKIFLTEMGETLYEKVFEPITRIASGNSVKFDKINYSKFIEINKVLDEAQPKSAMLSQEKRCDQIMNILDKFGTTNTRTLSEETGLGTAGIRAYTKILAEQRKLRETKGKRIYYFSKI